MHWALLHTGTRRLHLGLSHLYLQQRQIVPQPLKYKKSISFLNQVDSSTKIASTGQDLWEASASSFLIVSIPPLGYWPTPSFTKYLLCQAPIVWDTISNKAKTLTLLNLVFWRETKETNTEHVERVQGPRKTVKWCEKNREQKPCVWVFCRVSDQGRHLWRRRL